MSNKKVKDEGSTASGIAGYLGPLGYDPEKPKNLMIKRPKREVASNEIGQKDDDAFDALVAYCDLHGKNIRQVQEELKEIVRKRANQWVVFDDQTGVEKGAFNKRGEAWKRQRLMRAAKKIDAKARKNRKLKVKRKKKLTIRKENLLRMFQESVKRVLLSEGNKSALSYVFEQSPTSKDSIEWENFLQKLSKSTILSDPKLKGILQNMAKTEVKVLSMAVKHIADALKKDGGFETEQDKPDQDELGDLVLYFTVKLPESKKKFKFGVKIENGTPLLVFPPDTKDQLNALEGNEGKLLRVALMHCQETALDGISDLSNITQKRDAYLSKIQEDMSKVLASLDSLKIAMLRYVLKKQYGGIK